MKDNINIKQQSFQQERSISEQETFTVMPLQLEQRQKQANHQLLYKLADMYEGELFYMSLK